MQGIGKYRKHEVWEGYWCFEPIDEPELKLLKTLDYSCWKPRKDNKINIRIEMSDDNAELPTKFQVDTYEFIINNQERLRDGIWVYYESLILPVYKAAIDIGESEIAKSRSDLSTVFGVKAIEIPAVAELNSVYFLIEFDFRYDCEHGLYLLFRNDTPIDFFSDKDLGAIDIYEKGLYNEDKSPLRINITTLNGESILQGKYHFDESIDFNLPKGAYRILYTVNDSSRVRNFVVTEDRTSFSLGYVLRNCELF